MAPEQHEQSSTGQQISRPDPAQGPGHDIPKFVELIDGERTCMFTTLDADGTIISRPMAVQRVDDDATVWFMAFADSPKLDQLATHPEVNLSFGDGDTWVSASGTGRVVDDPAMKRELWNVFTKAWFQCEPEDPSVALIRVDCTGGEFWDSPSKPGQLLGLVKALTVGGEPVDGDNAKLELD